MSEEQQHAVIGRTLAEYQAAKKKLAALYAEAERLGNLFTSVGHSLRSNHSLGNQQYGAPQFDPNAWPSGEQLVQINTDIHNASVEKKRLGSLLNEAGFAQPD
jgi:hypothetical protein